MKAFYTTTIIYFALLFTLSAQTDQELVYASYFGGEDFDIVNDIAVDQQGNIYIAGDTYSETGIATTGAYQEFNNGGSDGFIAKFDSDYNLLWSSYFGGEDNDGVFSISILTNGEIVIVGQTLSEFGISTIGAYQEEFGGLQDAFIANFTQSGNLNWATYFGGESIDWAISSVSDAENNIYFVGQAASNGLATTGAYQENLEGFTDGFISKFSSNGNIQWATYFGGESGELLNSINMNAQSELILFGETHSETNIATENVYQENLNGDQDCFITKFTLDGERLWATYFGGNFFEEAYGIDSDESGNIIVSGYTVSTTNIATPGAHKTVKEGDDDFIASFTPDGQLNWGTYVGGERNEWGGNSIFLKENDIYFASRTDSENGIVNSSPYQAEFSGPFEPEFFNSDVYISKFNSSGTQIWGTYYGSTGFDLVNEIIMIDDNTIALACNTNSSDGMTTPDALDDELNGFSDGLFAVFDVDLLTGVNEIENSTLQVFPNPAKDYFIISLPELNAQNGRVEMFTMEGKRVAIVENYTLGSRISMDLSPGLYLVNYQTNEINYRTKLLVQ